MTAFFHLVLQVFYGAAGFFLVGGGYAEARSEGTSSIQALILISAVVSAGILLRGNAERRLLRDSMLVLAPCALAFASASWSPDAMFTFRKAFALLAATLTALAAVASLGTDGAIRLLTQSLVVTCVLSVIAVIVWPDQAIHHASSGVEVAHDGLWRGVVGHKVSLGMVAGLTVAMLLCHRDLGIANVPGRVAAIILALACIAGSGSATGIGVAAAYILLMRIARSLSHMQPARSRLVIRCLVILVAGVGYLIFSGRLDSMAWIVGRSGDLTGRATYWPHVTRFVDQYAYFFGFGYAAGYRFVAPIINDLSGHRLFEAHNGYIEMLVAFGRVGAGLVVVALGLAFLSACKLIERFRERNATAVSFPFAVLGTLFVVSYVESVFLMPTGVWTIMLPAAVAVIGRLARQDEVAASQGQTAEPARAAEYSWG